MVLESWQQAMVVGRVKELEDALTTVQMQFNHMGEILQGESSTVAIEAIKSALANRWTH